MSSVELAETRLDKACETDNAEIVTLAARRTGYAPFQFPEIGHRQARDGRVNALRALVLCQECAAHSVDHAGDTLLHAAVQCADAAKMREVVNYLVDELRMSPSTLNLRTGASALHAAIAGLNAPAVKLLLQLGADPKEGAYWEDASNDSRKMEIMRLFTYYRAGLF